MICAKCGYESDGRRGQCPRCGFNMSAQPAKTAEAEEVWQSMTQVGNFTRLQASEPASASPPGPALPQAGVAVSSTRPLLSGTSLRAGRYRVQEVVERQDWFSGAFEAMWTGRDLPRGKQVMICEVDVPAASPEQTLSIMRTATTSLLAAQRYPQIAPILDAFSDHGRSFFVFRPVQGETLLSRLRHSSRPLPEQEVVEFCLQMIDVLELLGQKSPTLVHGLISPEHVYLSRDGSQYILSNFSVLVAGRATAFLTGGDGAQVSPYMAPEFTRGNIDARNDIYSVLATAYHLVTGMAPTGSNTPHARSVNPAVSPAFDAVLARGLSSSQHQRYQYPAQLRQDLRPLRSHLANNSSLAPMRGHSPISANLAREESALPSISGRLASSSASPAPGFSFPNFASEPAYPFPIAPQPLEEEDQHALLPAPEQLPPMHIGNDRLAAAIMLAAILLSLGIITALSHFHV